MKTIMDAVNELRGDLENCLFGASPFETVLASRKYDGRIVTLNHCSDAADKICTVSEFNSLVAELSAWEPSPQIVYDKDGRGFEVGALYEFSHDGEEWHTDKLIGIDADDAEVQFETRHAWIEMARELTAPLVIGKIHTKPAELTDGEVYQFQVNSETKRGYAIKALSGKFALKCMMSHAYWDVSDCSNIKLMVAEA